MGEPGQFVGPDRPGWGQWPRGLHRPWAASTTQVEYMDKLDNAHPEGVRVGPFPGNRSGRRSFSTRRGWVGGLLLVCSAVLVGCGEGPDRVEDLPLVHELASPAGPGSGESNLAPDHDGGAWMSWLEPGSERDHALRIARFHEGVWTPARTVVERDSFFVNWADFPSVIPVHPDLLVAHWLHRGPMGGFDYSVRIAHSRDDGESWSEEWIPHEDGTNTEHGFVSIFPWGSDEVAAIWLDGRDYARFEEEGGGEGGADPPEMALRFRSFHPERGPGAKEVIDSRVCDCCQTTVALPGNGPVVAYRDRTEGEVRDISVARHDGEGWSTPRPVYDDGWEIPACPVNGPASDALGDLVVLAWFSAADDRPVVRVAFSRDGGATFGDPVRVDGGDPAGRVQVRFVDGEDVAVSWLERVSGAGEIHLRRVGLDGRRGRTFRVASTEDSRASGFPRMVALPGNTLLFSWTDPSGEGLVRTAQAEVPSW